MTYHVKSGIIVPFIQKYFTILTIAILALFATSFIAMTFSASADSVATDFESFSTGSVNGQDGWSMTGPFDVEVVNGVTATGFGGQSLRISNSVTSGAFGNQTFSKSLVNEAGETSALNGGLSGGTRSDYFEAQWDFASTVPGAEQPGLSVVASPDRGDGARMSWIQMADTPTGIDVNFYGYDTTLGGTCSDLVNFVYTPVETGLDRSVPHTIKVTMEFFDGVNNDVVKVYVDGALVHTGKSWEDYFRNCEAPESRTVDSVLFRVSGTAAPATSGEGFLIDNYSATSDSPFVDNTKPTAEFIMPADNESFSGSVDVEFKMTDADSGLSNMVVNIKDEFNSGHVGSCGSISGLGGVSEHTLICTIDVSGYTDGTYYLRAGGNDVAGNNRTISRPFIVDNTQPSLTIDSHSTGDWVNGPFTVFGTASDANEIDRVEYRVNKITGVGGTYVASVSSGIAAYNDVTDEYEFDVDALPNGVYRVQVRAYDVAENRRIKYVDIQVDNDRPTAEFVLPAIDGEVFSGTMEVQFKMTDVSSGLNNVVVNIKDEFNSAHLGTCGSANGLGGVSEHTLTCYIDLSGFVDGDYYLRAGGFDLAGNNRTISRPFTVGSVTATLGVNTDDNEEDKFSQEERNSGFVGPNGVLAAVTSNDSDDGGQGQGAVLADTTGTLADTGTPASLFITLSLFLISSTTLVYVASKNS